jgi:hypothetical protein
MAAASTASYALLNCLCANSLGANNWALFAPTKRHPLHLNENVVILMLGNVLVGIALSTKDLLTNRYVVKWPSKIVSTVFILLFPETNWYSRWTVFENTFYPQLCFYLVHHWLSYRRRACGIHTVLTWVLDVPKTSIPCCTTIAASWAILEVSGNSVQCSNKLTRL